MPSFVRRWACPVAGWVIRNMAEPEMSLQAAAGKTVNDPRGQGGSQEGQDNLPPLAFA